MANPTQKSTPSPRKVLEGAFSPKVVEALDARIKEVSKETFGEMKAELTEMIEAHKTTIAAARQLPASERAAVAPAVDETTGKLKAAAADLNEVGEQLKADQAVAPEKVDKAVKSTDEAGKAVEQTSGAVSEQLAALKEQGDRHAAILDGTHEGVRPLSRLDGIEERLDSLELCQEEQGNVIASAFAQARASINGGNAARQAAMVGLVTFGVTFLVYAILVWLTPLQWEWDNAIGLPAIAAGLAAAIMYLRNADHGVEVLTYADAATIVAAERQGQRASGNNHSEEDDNGRLSIMDDEEPQHHGTHASASAAAHAGHR